MVSDFLSCTTAGWTPSYAEKMRLPWAGRMQGRLCQQRSVRAFPPGAILFLDQEEGGRLLPEQSAYLFAWIESVRTSQYKPGVYCSGIVVNQINTAQDILSHPDGRSVALWVWNDACPPAPGCALPKRTLTPAASGVSEARVWQFARAPKTDFARQCGGYAADNNCYTPDSKTFVDLNLSTSPDPSRGR